MNILIHDAATNVGAVSVVIIIATLVVMVVVGIARDGR